MLLLANVFLSLWLSTAKGEVKPCDFPHIKNGGLYHEGKYRAYFPASVGKQFSYYCKRGFVIHSGTHWGYIRCTTQGWEPAVPCLRQCSFPYVDHGVLLERKASYVQDQSAKVKCYSGYRLPNGQDTITCTENGWSPQPKCIRVNSTKTCGPPPPIDNGDITSFPLPVYAPLSSVEYQCQSLYRLQGNKKITCRNGEWSEKPKCLHPCIVSEGILETHNIIFRWREKQKRYYESGEMQEFRCKNGYHLAASQTLNPVCNDGHIVYPTCTKSH
ncbi:Cfhr1 [Phodopus roborovskii]|uniref:Cfhr1 protein n=1 Tax=Phodopus roborovskii TaxID=109678 RepID=A0AAU9Z724_PHORO|nr:Cfhr1 [Phodopus roborovskii]